MARIFASALLVSSLVLVASLGCGSAEPTKMNTPAVEAKVHQKLMRKNVETIHETPPPFPK